MSLSPNKDQPATTPAIAMVAIDLDGTLLDPAKQIDDETVAALRDVTRSGRRVVIASARPPRSVRPIYNRLGLDTLQVNYNGALIWDEQQQAQIAHTPIRAALTQRIIAAARDLFDEVQVTCEILDRWYTDHYDPAHTTETGKLFGPDVITPLKQFAHLDVTKLMLLGEPRMMLRLESLVAEKFAEDVTVVRTDDDLIQIMDKDVSKSRAVETVAKSYGLTMAQVLAIGDAPNDFAMVRDAGIGVAMGNAHPLVKEVARWIAPPNTHRGVLAALQRFGLV
jgi:Cof subfamily protein (haloacid dehalogenase superfamily)